jgi:hypothetical protein
MPQNKHTHTIKKAMQSAMTPGSHLWVLPRRAPWITTPCLAHGWGGSKWRGEHVYPMVLLLVEGIDYTICLFDSVNGSLLSSLTLLIWKGWAPSNFISSSRQWRTWSWLYTHYIDKQGKWLFLACLYPYPWDPYPPPRGLPVVCDGLGQTHTNACCPSLCSSWIGIDSI